MKFRGCHSINSKENIQEGYRITEMVRELRTDYALTKLPEIIVPILTYRS